jgi:hypothetical protein
MQHPDHQQGQELSKAKWYTGYSAEIVHIEKTYEFLYELEYNTLT